jgi:hypothetical protein
MYILQIRVSQKGTGMTPAAASLADADISHFPPHIAIFESLQSL